MGLEDGLIVGVALVIVLNRVFTGTGLVRSGAAYVFVQAFDVGACLALFFARIFPDARLDLAVRGFLMLFVAWHMVTNSAARAALRKPSPLEADALDVARRAIEAQIERERREEEAAAEAGPGSVREAGPGPGGDPSAAEAGPKPEVGEDGRGVG